MAFKSRRICGIFWNQLQPRPTLAVPGSLPPSLPQELRDSLSSPGVCAGCALALAIGVVSGTVRLWSGTFPPHHVLFYTVACTAVLPTISCFISSSGEQSVVLNHSTVISCLAGPRETTSWGLSVAVLVL